MKHEAGLARVQFCRSLLIEDDGSFDLEPFGFNNQVVWRESTKSTDHGTTLIFAALGHEPARTVGQEGGTDQQDGRRHCL